MVCLSICAWHSVLMGVNGSEEGPDAGACLRKCSRAESYRLGPPRGFLSPLVSVYRMNKWWDFIHHRPRVFFTSSSIMAPSVLWRADVQGFSRFRGTTLLMTTINIWPQRPESAEGERKENGKTRSSINTGLCEYNWVWRANISELLASWLITLK